MYRTSVVIATYNGEKFIEEQLRSITSQLNGDSEIIISDNGSTDKTVEIINGFNDNRILLLTNNITRGTILNFENALKKATGDIIFLSDQDDIWLPGKIEICKKYLGKYHLVVTDGKVVNEDLTVISDSLFKIYNSGTGIFKNLIRNSFIGCCIAFRREILPLVLPFPKKIPMHDIWLGFVAEMFFSVYFIENKLVLHRRHTTNESTTFNKSKFTFIKKIQLRINILRYVPLLLKRKHSFYNHLRFSGNILV
jgi:glycosyltransferase involved in cell wall biosynthesis